MSHPGTSGTGTPHTCYESRYIRLKEEIVVHSSHRARYTTLSELTSTPTPAEMPEGQAGKSGTRKKESTRMLQAVHASLAHHLTQALSRYLDAPTVALTLLEETTFTRYLVRHGAPGWAITFAHETTPMGRIHLTHSLAQLIVDHLLGYQGERVIPQGPLSAIEIHLLHQLTYPLLTAYADAWGRYLDIAWQSQEDADGDPNEPLYLASFEVGTPRGHGQLDVLLRLPAWTPFLDEACSQRHAAATTSTNARMLDSLGACQIHASVILGRTAISVGDLLDLRVGDIICLDQDPGAPVEVRVGAQAKFLGNVHVENDHFVLTVDRLLAGRAQPDGSE